MTLLFSYCKKQRSVPSSVYQYIQEHTIHVYTSYWYIHVCISLNSTIYTESCSLPEKISTGLDYFLLAAYRIVMKTWRENSAIPMHALIIGYGLGSIVVPQLVTPFLDKRFSANGRLLATATNISTCAEATMRNQSAVLHDVDELEPEYPAKFVKAYWIVAQVSFVLAVFFVIHYVHGKVTGTRIDPPKKTGHQSMKNTLSIRNCSTDHPKYAAALITGLFFFYFSAFAIVRVFTKLIFSYARNGPCLSVQMSTAIESTYFVSLTAGRLVALFVTMVLHMKYILMVSDKTTAPSESFGCLEFGPEFLWYFLVHLFKLQHILVHKL